MTRPPLKVVGASVRKRLTDKARQRDENAQMLMLRFAIERLIFRLTQSVYRDQFILKGAMLFLLWAPVPDRSTGDLNLLRQAIPRPPAWPRSLRRSVVLPCKTCRHDAFDCR